MEEKTVQKQGLNSEEFKAVQAHIAALRELVKRANGQQRDYIYGGVSTLLEQIYHFKQTATESTAYQPTSIMDMFRSK